MTAEIILSVVLVVVFIVSFICITLQAVKLADMRTERDSAFDAVRRLDRELRRYADELGRIRAEQEPTRNSSGEAASSMYAIRDNLTAPHHYMGAMSEGDAVFSDNLTVGFDPAFLRGESPEGYVSGNTARERNQWTGQDRKRS